LNTGPHMGNLWTNGGSLLGTVTFTDETSTGWQQALLPAPVPVTANTSYVVSYHAPTGYYSADAAFFQNVGVTNGPLEALADGEAGSNGVFVYGESTFPNQSNNSANYWVDVVFSTIVTIDTTAPVISAVDATATADSASISWTTQEVASSRIDYGTNSPALDMTVSVPGLTTSHAVRLPSLANETTYYYRVTSIDASGNSSTLPTPLAAPFSFATLAALVLNCPCSIWPETATPSQVTTADTNAAEVGMRFQTAEDGFITAIRFYKGPMNTGPHTGSLWTNSGSLLGTVTFTDETSTGWQQATLPAPVTVTANTPYVVSYHTAMGSYSADVGYFESTGVTSGPLAALQNGAAGPNGTYRYGTSGFPTDTWYSTNYWVDVVFVTGEEIRP